MDVATTLPPPAPRRGSELTRWRRAVHGAMHAALALACAAGASASMFVGPAAGPEWCVWLMVLAVAGAVGAFDPRRLTSAILSGTLVLTSVATLLILYGTALQADRDAASTSGMPWARDVFAVAVLASLIAGPVAFLVHVLLFWREDCRVRAATA